MSTERVKVKAAFLGSSQVPYRPREKASFRCQLPSSHWKGDGHCWGAPIRLLGIQGLSQTGQKTIPWDLRSCERVLPGHHPPRLQDR